MVDWEAFFTAFREPGFVPGYEIQEHLGGGAFGEVYRARKTSIGKSYAIKFLKVGGDESKGAVARELEHVRHFAQIDHPNLVTIEDMGQAGGVPYLIMGYAGQDTLARRIQQRDLDQNLALRLFVQIVRGVLALHDRSLAHFDLKPGNVFLNGDTARVGDYGLAKLLADGRQTLSVGRGTPQYMAPEMLRNRADTRADIYSLGVILYESLTFRLPFEPESGVGLVVREDDVPPEFPPGFPTALIGVVSRCLRLDPSERYPGVRELLVALGQDVEGEAIALGTLAKGPEPPPLPALEGTVPRALTGRRAPGAPLRDPDGFTGRPALESAKDAPGLIVKVTDEDSDIVSAASLEESDEQGGATGEEASPAARGAGKSKPSGRWGAPASGIRRPAAPLPPLRNETVGTIPVPPRSEGGVFGTLWEAGVLGAEMLGTLLGWPLRVGTRLLARGADRATRFVPGALGGFLGGLFFFLGCFVLGGLFALVLVAAFTLFAT